MDRICHSLLGKGTKGDFCYIQPGQCVVSKGDG